LKNPNWTREQALACFNLYSRIPFGRFDQDTPEVIAFANAVKRTPSAVAMKLGNFASFDPAHQRRNVKGLRNVSSLDRALWAEFEATPNKIAQESEEAFSRLSIPAPLAAEQEPAVPTGPTETQATRPTRLVQSFFRRSVLAAYGYKCSFCKLDVPTLLNASHIIPWNVSEERRADPRNGLCLCALHDRAFDRGLMTLDIESRLLISERLKKSSPSGIVRAAFLDLEGQRINLPVKFLPSEKSLEYHRAYIFM
jgi:predicted restriction endonuclease